MDARKKVHRINPQVDEELHDKIKQTTTNLEESEDMQKDLHLLDAARETDQTIISLDETIRRLFAQATQHVGEIRDIIWVNPERTEAEPLDWLKNGAPPEERRKLRSWADINLKQ